MDRTIEEKLVPLLEAVGAPITRAEIFKRVSEDVEDEEHLARVLGRLCADGTLVRRERPRFNSTPEFIYGTPKTIDVGVSPQLRKSIEEPPAPAGPRLAAIAAAAKKAMPTPTPAKEASMPKDLSKYVEYLTPARGWLNPATIGDALAVNRVTAAKYLRQLVDEGRIQTKGELRGLRFGHLDLDETDTPGSAAADPKKEKKKKPRKPSRSARLRAARPRPETPAPQLPVPIPRRGAPTPDEFICCAIEDSGVVAITNGAATIRLSPAKINQVVQFLEHTQLIWKGSRT